MSRTTHHFDWKKLEEKPDNWETLRQLIGLCNSADDNYTEQPSATTNNAIWDCVGAFQAHATTRYGKQAAAFFPPPKTKTEEKNKPKNKKTKNPLREKIQQETERKLLEKEFQTIRFDNGRPTRTTFRVSSVFYFMIAEWNIWLLSQKKPKVSRHAIVDAMISMDRIMVEEIRTNPGIPDDTRAFFEGVHAKSQDLLPRDEVFDELFSQHPELMVNPFSQKRVGRTALYKEQVELLTHVADAVMLNAPLLLGDRMPPGTGKTFLAVPLAQKLLALKCGKTLLFACHNPLVRTDVASLSLLGKSVHLWMGRFDNSSGKREFLIRPHKSCFPVNWKQVYKAKDDKKTADVCQQCAFYKKETGRFPDILVADLETCAELLRDDLLRDQFVAYIDEFVSDDYANSVMVEIVRHLPPQSVLLSAILPRFEDMPSVIRHFQQRHHNASIVRIESNQLLISCTLVSPDGRACLPHHFIESPDQVPTLIQRIREDPLIGRMYSPQQVFLMTEQVRDDLPAHLLFHHRFPTIGLVDHQKVRDYVLDLLAHAADHPDTFHKMRSYRPRLMEENPSPEKVATVDSHHYQGKTLVITTPEDRFPLLEKIRQSLHQDAPDLQLMLDTLEKKKKELMRLLEATQSAQRSSTQKIDATDQQQRITRIQDELCAADRVRWPEQLIVNTPAHARRFNHTISHPATPPILSKEHEDAFSGFLLSLLLSGIGVYDFSQCTEHQRRLTMRVMRQLSFLFAGHEIVFGTNIDGLTHLFIDGNYGDHVSRNVLLQLCGRVGRVGHSYEALLVVNSETTLRSIMDFIDPVDEDAKYFETQFAT